MGDNYSVFDKNGDSILLYVKLFVRVSLSVNYNLVKETDVVYAQEIDSTRLFLQRL